MRSDQSSRCFRVGHCHVKLNGDDNDDHNDDDSDDDNDDDRFLNVIVPFGKGAKNLTIPT